MTGSVQQQADAMLNANYDCVIDNDQPACVFAQNAYAQLDHIYVQTMQAANLQGYGSQQFHDQLAAHTGGYVDPRSHQTNMRQIQAWGQAGSIGATSKGLAPIPTTKRSSTISGNRASLARSQLVYLGRERQQADRADYHRLFSAAPQYCFSPDCRSNRSVKRSCRPTRPERHGARANHIGAHRAPLRPGRVRGRRQVRPAEPILPRKRQIAAGKCYHPGRNMQPIRIRGVLPLHPVASRTVHPGVRPGAGGSPRPLPQFRPRPGRAAGGGFPVRTPARRSVSRCLPNRNADDPTCWCRNSFSIRPR